MLAQVGLGVLLAVTALAALRLGSARERVAVVILAVASGASALMPADPRVGLAVWGLLAVDLVAVLLLGRLTWKTPSAWPVWALAPQGVAAAASLAFALQPDVGAETYLRGLLITRYAAVLALLIGTCRPQQAQP